MPLADNIVISIDRLPSVELRPCLRAAIRLERHHGFQKLSRGIVEGSYSIISAIVRECAPTRDDAHAILSIRPIGKLIEQLSAPCHALVLALAGIDEAAKPKSGRTGKAGSFPEYFGSLYRVATGNLGWSPDAAYSATPVEIIEAAQGRADLLMSIFGGSKPEEPAKPSDPATIDHRPGIARLREIFSTRVGDQVGLR